MSESSSDQARAQKHRAKLAAWADQALESAQRMYGVNVKPPGIQPHQDRALESAQRTYELNCAINEGMARLGPILARRKQRERKLLAKAIATSLGRNQTRQKQQHNRSTKAETEHSEDFTSVVWFGTLYRFNKTQAKCIELLWAEWKKGGLGLSEKTIGEKLGSANDRYRLSHTFRSKGGSVHRAWGTMIKPVGKGIFCLSAPDHQ